MTVEYARIDNQLGLAEFAGFGPALPARQSSERAVPLLAQCNRQTAQDGGTSHLAGLAWHLQAATTVVACPGATGWSVWGKYLSPALNSSGSVSGTMHAMADRFGHLAQERSMQTNLNFPSMSIRLYREPA
jgi:hypothetical protein